MPKRVYIEISFKWGGLSDAVFLIHFFILVGAIP